MSGYLPVASGLLPYWLLLTSAASVYNAVQNYFILWQTKEIYSLKPHEVTPLAARLFGVWTLTSAAIRGYAAYNLDNPVAYNLAIATYAIAFWHFGSEMALFRTVTINRAAAAPLVVATSSLIWTISQRSFYLK